MNTAAPGGGTPLVAISNAIVRFNAEYYGKGPTRARSHLVGDLLICVLEDNLTPLELTLVARGREDQVRALRGDFQYALKDEFVDVVQRASGRMVRAFLSQVHINPDIAIEVFMLEPPARGRLEDVPTPPHPDDGGRPRPGEGAPLVAISNAIVRFNAEYYGKGPARARSHLVGDLLICVLEDNLTPLELTLVARGREDQVRALRGDFQYALKDEFVDVVQRASGRMVRAFLSQVHIDPDIAIEVFMLEPPGAAAGHARA